MARGDEVEGSSSTRPNPFTNGKTPEMMPRAGEKSAPAKFYSAKQDIQEFLKKFQNLCVAFNVPEADYGEKLLDYCSKKVRDLS